MNLNLLIILCLFVLLIIIFPLIIKGKKRREQEANFNEVQSQNQNSIVDNQNDSLYVDYKANRKDVIDAENINFLTLSFQKNALIDLQNQLKLSNLQLDNFIYEAAKSYNQLIIDFGDIINENSEDDVRYVPIEFSTKNSILNFDETYVCHLSLIDRKIYSYHIYDRWLDENSTLEQAYNVFCQKIEALRKQGWENYFFPYQVRYATSNARHLLKIEQHLLIQEHGTLSFQEFSDCLVNSENNSIYLYLHLDGIYMSLIFINTFSALVELNKMDDFIFYKNYSSLMNSEIDNLEEYKIKAEIFRKKLEQEAIAQNIEINENYVDHFPLES